MSRIHENLEDKDFDKPATVGEATVCKDTGMLPTYNCPTVTELFDTTELPNKRCTKHGGGAEAIILTVQEIPTVIRIMKMTTKKMIPILLPLMTRKIIPIPKKNKL